MMLLCGLLVTLLGLLPPASSSTAPPARRLATGRFSWATRGNDRFLRFLPGAKASSGGSKSSSVERRDCQGEWSGWGACDASGKQSRAHSVTAPASGGGASCPSSPETRACADCVGVYSCWGACVGGKQSRAFRVKTKKSGSGKACALADGATVQRSCTAPDHEIAWGYYADDKTQWAKESVADVLPLPKAAELTVVHCDLGETVEFTWKSQAAARKEDAQATGHDLWKLGNEEDYATCTFEGSSGSELVPHAASAFPASYGAAPETCAHQFSCDTPGTHFFACSVAGACSNGMQRVRVWVTDSSKTRTLRAQQPQLTTLANAMSKHLVPVAYSESQNPVADSVAANISAMLRAIETFSPGACADWLIPSDLSDAKCKAFALTDRGFIERVRATPNFTLAASYYADALSLVAGFCPAESYLTELRVKEGVDKSAADAQFEVACAACGTDSLDMTDVRLAYYRKGWAVPANSACKEEVPKRLSASELAAAVEQALKDVRGSGVGASPSSIAELLGSESAGQSISRRGWATAGIAVAVAVVALTSVQYN